MWADNRRGSEYWPNIPQSLGGKSVVYEKENTMMDKKELMHCVKQIDKSIVF